MPKSKMELHVHFKITMLGKILDWTALSVPTLFLHKFYGCPALYVVLFGMLWEKKRHNGHCDVACSKWEFQFVWSIDCEDLEIVSPKLLSEMFAHPAIHL